MGNIVPKSMENLPDGLKLNEYIEITTENGTKYYVHKRSFGRMIGNNFRQSFSGENMALNALGRGFGLGDRLSDINNELNEQRTSHFYITTGVNDKEEKALRSSIDATSVKVYIALFFKELLNDNKADLEKCTFKVKTKNNSGFGKKGRKTVKRSTLKRLQADLRVLKLA